MPFFSAKTISESGGTSSLTASRQNFNTTLDARLRYRRTIFLPFRVFLA